MKMKKTLCILLAVVTALSCVLAFTACNKDGKDPSDAANPSETGAAVSSTLGANDLANVKKAGKIVVGMECDYKPYNWAQTTENENTVKIKDGMYADGYDVQVAKKVAEALGVTLEIKPMEWDGLIPALNSGNIDAVIAGMSPTADRRISVDFSDTYFDSILVMVVRKDSAYASATKIADFKGAKITGQHNTFHYEVIDQIEGVKKQAALPNFAALTQALAAGSIDGYVCERPGAKSAVESNKDFTFIEFAESNGFKYDLTDASIAVAMRKGSSLTSEINKVIASLTSEQKDALMLECIARQPGE